MNNLVLKEKQEFIGIQIPVIEGGFGENQKVILGKTIAEIHELRLDKINSLINNNLEEFEEGIDILDLKNSNLTEVSLLELGFTKQTIANSKNIYLLSEQGYMALVGLMRTDKAKEIRRKLRREYFAMKAEIKENSFDISELSPELQMFNKMLQAVAKSELEQKRIKQQLNEVNYHALEAKEKADKSIEEIQAMREVVATNTTNWREECRKIIVKIAHKLGGNSYIHDVQTEVYSLMRTRLRCKLDVKLTNMRRRMAEEGICKSKRDKKNYLDVIEDDARLKEGYIAIVKDLAFKYGVA
ncbi:ORF6N domain-containing protein [Clostridium perfringens]|uniref:ORF6N domain-containing protein n=2 Tax=Clostridium perfringens TaxID=1502 RepID=A0AAP7BW98_CLOPF|nr:ORF6N domain-containing protein [Clostridium perfringens]NP_612855.1 anti-repressor [Clostridium phage phi3626]AAL96796.1 Gp26 protein [Clostridium phage phi3626]NGU30637.1 ORF6N domain-containing protein [Clostridium perfringens]WEV05050.1 ORF6N domain-containing protein [Clostridium perfringens B]